jgi:transcription initiation factor TFIIIB Brf1 subunit/transcription initiation factor TFIIB
MGKKKLCDRVKQGHLDKKFNKYVDIVENSEYVCMKCGRVAEKKNVLCKPKAFYE